MGFKMLEQFDKPLGRPTKYNEELAERICDAVATHPVGLEHIVKMHADFPDAATIYTWRRKYPIFHQNYLDAKALQAALLVEEIDSLISSELLYYYDDKGHKRLDSASASLLIAKINNRKWTAARLAPDIYSERNKVETSVKISHEDALKELE
jgi:hypothetical protein